MTYPQYKVHWKTGHGELVRDFAYHTPIGGHQVSTHQIRLAHTGDLLLKAGYLWDFGSGPAVDTPDMVYASLCHDAFYELMARELIPWELRKRVDLHFRDLLRLAGMGWARRQWVYYGVRLGYPIAAALGGGSKRPLPEDYET